MPNINFPCTNCGASLPITEGSIVRCFACGMKNVYSESFNEFDQYIIELFGYPKAIDEIESSIDESTLNERMAALDKAFNDSIAQSRQIEYVLISKLDEVTFDENILEVGENVIGLSGDYN